MHQRVDRFDLQKRRKSSEKSRSGLQSKKLFILSIGNGLVIEKRHGRKKRHREQRSEKRKKKAQHVFSSYGSKFSDTTDRDGDSEKKSRFHVNTAWKESCGMISIAALGEHLHAGKIVKLIELFTSLRDGLRDEI